MKTVIASGYEGFGGIVSDIVSGSYTADYTYCCRRNVVERVLTAEGAVVVKRFKRPNALNRVVYSFCRKSKARRAYEYGIRLASLGFDTPAPVAYVEKKKGLLFHTGWFISLYAEGTPFSRLYADMREQSAAGNRQIADKIRLLREQLVAFSLRLLSGGVRPGDFNHDNILVSETDDGFRFALVDINRMRFGERPTLRKTMKMYSQFCRDYQDAVDFLSIYARLTGEDFDKCMYVFAGRRNHLLKRKIRKQRLHRLQHLTVSGKP